MHILLAWVSDYSKKFHQRSALYCYFNLAIIIKLEFFCFQNFIFQFSHHSLFNKASNYSEFSILCFVQDFSDWYLGKPPLMGTLYEWWEPQDFLMCFILNSHFETCHWWEPSINGNQSLLSGNFQSSSGSQSPSNNPSSPTKGSSCNGNDTYNATKEPKSTKRSILVSVVAPIASAAVVAFLVILFLSIVVRRGKTPPGS